MNKRLGEQFRAWVYGHRSLSFLLLGITAGVVATTFLRGTHFLALLPERARLQGVAAVSVPTLAALTNNDRTTNGLGALSENQLLDQAAKQKADDMAQKGYFAHVTPDGRTPLNFLDTVGYKYQNVGENLGLNYDDAASVETGWMNSPEHRANILLPQFTEHGVGVSSGVYQGALATFVVELFATPLPVRPVAVAAPAAVVTSPAVMHRADATPLSRTTSVPTNASSSRAVQIQQLKDIILSLQKEIQRLTDEVNALQ